MHVAKPVLAAIGVVNQSGSTVVFERVRLLPLRGFATPRLVAVRRGRPPYLLSYWPSAKDTGLIPLRGTRLRSGEDSLATLDLKLVRNTAGSTDSQAFRSLSGKVAGA